MTVWLLSLAVLCLTVSYGGLQSTEKKTAPGRNSPGAVTQSNWPQWRGPGGQGIANDANLPVEWSATKNVAWKTAIPGRSHSSPIIWGNRIFLTTNIEGPVVSGAKAVQHIRGGQVYRHPDATAGDRRHTMKVLALDGDSGRILWERTAYEGTVHDDRHRKGAYASCTPVTDGRYVYAWFEAEGLYCYDFAGKLIWKTTLGPVAKMGLGHGVSPVLYNNLVIIQADQEDGGADAGSFIAAVDKRTGRERWRTARLHRKTWATPLIVRSAARAELIASGAESVIAYDPESGRELWRSAGVAGHAIPSAVAGHGLVFLCAGYPTKKAVALRPGGAGDVSATNVAWSYDRGTAYVASPILYGDYLYLISDKGILTCLDARSGQVRYEGGRVPVPSSFTSSPVAFDNKLFLTSEDGDTFVIKAGPQHEVLRTNSLDEPVYASIAIADRSLFIRSLNHLWRISNGAGE